MRLRLPLVVALAATVTACLDPLEAPNGRFGSIAVPTYDDGASGTVLVPEATFYDKTDVSFVPFPNDTCVLAPYSETTVISGSLLTLDAGQYITTNVSGRTDSLQKVAGLTIRTYRPLVTTGIPYTPGDTISVSIPGAVGGFPQSAISIRTAEPFTHTPIGVPESNQSMDISWTPAATVPGSQMTFSLRYANAVSTTGRNEQIFCSFADDGGGTIGANLLSGWINALNDNREVRAVRIRWSELTVDARTRLSIVSSYAQPLLTLTPSGT